MFFMIVLPSFELFCLLTLFGLNHLTSLSLSSSSQSLSLYVYFSLFISLCLLCIYLSVGPVFSIFFCPSGCCFSVNCFQLMTHSLTHYSSFFVLSSCCCCSVLLCFSSILHPPCSCPLLPLYLTTSTPLFSGSDSLCLPLVFSRRSRS